MKFSLVTWKITISLGLVACLAASSLFFVTFSDLKSYKILQQEAKGDLNQPYSAVQERKKVMKNILFNRDGERQKARLLSEEVSIFIQKEGDETEIVEKMKELHFLIQEELFDESQNLFSLEAQEATYSFQKGLLEAKDVKLERFTVPGDTLPDSLEGVTSSLRGKANELQFVCKNDRAREKITLLGEVFLEHPLGNIKAEKVVFEIPLQNVELTGNVQFLADRGTLSANRALLDLTTAEGHFFGDDGFVVYSEEKNFPLIVKSRRMWSQMDKKVSEKLRKLLAEEEVTVVYNHDLTITSHQGIYQSQPQGEGIITLKSGGPSHPCKVVRKNGDTLLSEEIELYLPSKKMLVKQPRGTLQTLRGDPIHFSAETLHFDEDKGELILQKEIIVHGMGELTCDEVLTLEIPQGKLTKAKAKGKSILKHQDNVLTSYGLLSVDLIALEAHVDGEKPLLFENNRGKIFADRAFLKYRFDNHKMVPKYLNFSGSARLYNQNSPLQYALADTVEFFPDKKEVHFKADKGKRVLYYDRGKEIQLSAPALIIRRDKEDKDHIQGIGDVRFSFVDKELDELTRSF